MSEPKAPEDFAGWNEQMIQRHDPEIFYRHPIRAVRWVETLRVKAILRGLDLKPTHTLLDAGCGAGSLLEKLVCRELHGIELSGSMVQRARSKLNESAQIIHGDAESLPYPDGAFDRVVASSLLSHVLHPERVVAELRRVAKSGARIVVSISNEAQIERGMQLANKFGLQRILGGEKSPGAQHAYHVDYHLHRFSMKRLRELVANSMEELSVMAIPFRFFPVHCVAVYGRP
jgi:ubiquinone/menaquinone biosynthesis C-methylase UbiE